MTRMYNTIIDDFPEQNLDILWQPVQSGKNGARILRVYGEHPCLKLPETIDNIPVTEIGAYCFSRSEPKITGEYYHFFIKNKMYTNEERASQMGGFADKERGLTGDISLKPLSGSALEAVFLPSGITTLHNAAFYNCRELRLLSMGNRVRSIGSDEFTNCSRLAQLIFRGSDKTSASLSLLLERIPDDLNVLFKPDGEINGALFFPEYYEWLDEISPAHIFSRSIHGEGFRMRKCFENNRIDYNKYDRCFENALKNESEKTLCQIAINRLRWPGDLSDEFHETYENALKIRLKTAVSLAIESKDLSLLLFICRYFSADDFTAAIKQCLDADWGEAGAQLMEEKHRIGSFSKKEFTFDEW